MILRTAALFVLSALAAYGAGTVVPSRLLRSSAERWGLRIAAGLALYATVFFALAAFGRLRRAELAAAAGAGIAAAAWNLRRSVRRSATRGPAPVVVAAALAALLAGAFVLALYPPTAFDETLYHLPTVGAFAASGRMPFLASLRAPVFPNAAEALEVPLWLFGGDAATHLVPLLATAATALLVFAGAQAAGDGAAWLAAAIFVSSPIVLHLASSGYVEAPLTLFCFGAFVAIGRGREGGGGRRALAAGLAGAAASVKYLGLPWVAGAAVAAAALSPRGKRLRAAAMFSTVAAAVLAPWYLRIFRSTGNPVFPFLPGLFGHSAWDAVGLSHPGGIGRAAGDFLRLPWDTLFARGRVNFQPPFSPWFLLASPLLAWFVVRDRRARVSIALCLGWGVFWLAMPRDSRYLAVVLPILSVEIGRAAADAAHALGRRLPASFAALAVLPGIAYAAWRIVRQGPVPLRAAERERYLAEKVPGYRAVAFLNRTAPRETVFVCGGEQLRWYYAGTMIGDVSGIARYDEILALPDGAAIARRLDALGVRYVVRVRRACRASGMDRRDFPFRPVYEDGSAVVEERSAPR
ncbi:MAG TPA: hypothetical protein VKH46_10195 [Thermoanaerobaculia bacterium]|nr:hypothetical protein [Thermoanaerobaculia bacterium]